MMSTGQVTIGLRITYLRKQYKDSSSEPEPERRGMEHQTMYEERELLDKKTLLRSRRYISTCEIKSSLY